MVGTTECTQCGVGKFSGVLAGTSANNCTLCAPELYAVANQSSCVGCEFDTYCMLGVKRYGVPISVHIRIPCRSVATSARIVCVEMDTICQWVRRPLQHKIFHAKHAEKHTIAGAATISVGCVRYTPRHSLQVCTKTIACATKVTSDTRTWPRTMRQNAGRARRIPTLVRHSTRSVRSAPSVAMGFCGTIRRRCVMCAHPMSRWRLRFVCAMPGRSLGPLCNVCRVRKTTCVRGHFPV